MYVRMDEQLFQIARYPWSQQECKCVTVWEPISAAGLLCELLDIFVAYHYAAINMYRAGGIDPCKLPMSQALVQEIIMKRDNVNPQYNGAMHTMAEKRMLMLEREGFHTSGSKALLAQIDSLDSALGVIDKTSVNALELVNNFLLFWLFVYGAFIVWVLSPYGQIAAIIIATVIQYLFAATLMMLEKQANPFENAETNPYSTIPVQNWKHEIASLVTIMFLNAFRDIRSKQDVLSGSGGGGGGGGDGVKQTTITTQPSAPSRGRRVPIRNGTPSASLTMAYKKNGLMGDGVATKAKNAAASSMQSIARVARNAKATRRGGRI
jgi:hypothetical protein